MTDPPSVSRTDDCSESMEIWDVIEVALFELEDEDGLEFPAAVTVEIEVDPDD